MNVILYMAASLNGLAEDGKGRTPWGGPEWNRYKGFCSDSGCLIVGRKTHDIMNRDGEYDCLGVGSVIVLTKTSVNKQKSSVSLKTASSPLEALELARDMGFEKVIVGGGSSANASFLKEKLINRVCIDIEPFLFGEGRPVFNLGICGDFDLELVKIDHYAPNSLGLEYCIK